MTTQKQAYDMLLEWFDHTVVALNEAQTGSALQEIYEELPVKFYTTLNTNQHTIWFAQKLEVYELMETPYSLYSGFPTDKDAKQKTVDDLDMAELFSIKAFIFGVLNAIMGVLD